MGANISVLISEEDVNERIIRNLFNSKMIDLNNTIIQTKVEDGKLVESENRTGI